MALVVIVVVAFSLSSGEDGASGSPSETVTAYLEALRDGDAEKALSYGKGEPASKDFLTDEVLGKQIAEMPISNIRILDKGEAQASFGFALVKVAANFGDTLSETTLHLTKVEDEWKLDNTFARIDTDMISGGKGAGETLTLFDKPIKDQSVVYVFPGMLDVGSTNDYLDVEADSTVDLQALALGTASLLPTYGLNDKGHDAVAAAVADAFTACERSRELNPPGCPYRITRADAVEGTVTWGRANLSEVTMNHFSTADMAALVSGPVVIPVSFQVRDGNTARGDFEDYLTGSVDMTLTPPRLVLS